jgi:HD-GYP domain-containing protein (c-di-GMP phosphodiesterase class II)
MARKLVPVRLDDLVVNDPLPFSIYDKNGLPLARMGSLVGVHTLEKLAEIGFFYEYDEEKVVRQPLPPFDEMEYCKVQLRLLFDRHKKGGLEAEEFLVTVDRLVSQVEYISEHDAEAGLASLHLDCVTEYSVLHHLQAAQLCELVARRAGLHTYERRSVVAAALTHDIGISDIQDTIERHDKALSEGHKARIRTHTGDGIKVLEGYKVKDREWLDAVSGHHERMDGSGYPAGLKGEELSFGARLLAVADAYSAMVRDRPYRKARLSRDALRHLFQEQTTRLDPQMTQRLIKAIGVFPPGSLVKLKNGEVAVVKSCGSDASNPVVYAFAAQNGLPMPKPKVRDTRNDEHAIVGLASLSTYKNWIALVRKLWQGV